MQTKKTLGNLLLLMTAVIWGLAFTAQKIAGDRIPPFALNGIRFLLGAFVLIPALFVLDRTRGNGRVFLSPKNPHFIDLTKRELLGGIACGAALLVFALTFALPVRVRVGVPFLFPLGLRTAAFASADYYPLLPWGALFFAAAAAAERLGDMPPERKYESAPRALVWMSRRSLFIYLVHQPVLLALAALLQRAAQGA